MKPSAILYIFNFILFILLLFPYSNVYKGQQLISRKNILPPKRVRLYSCLLLCLSIFAFSDNDFWGCWLAYDLSRDDIQNTIIEPLYAYLAQLMPNYFAWRFIIWGIAVYLMIKTIKRLGVTYKATFVFITLLYVLSFYKLRNVLGFSVLFWGLSLIICPDKNRTMSIIKGLVFIILSFWCHKTMIISILLLSGCVFKLTKFRMSLLIIIWPFLISAITILINHMISGVLELGNDDMGFASRAMTYVTYENQTVNLNGKIRIAILESAILIPLVYMTKKIIYEKIRIPHTIEIFYRYWFVTMFVAYLFAFQDAANWIYIRISTMSYFPMCIVLGWYWATHRRTLAQRLILSLCLLAYLYSTFYMVYSMDLIGKFRTFNI